MSTSFSLRRPASNTRYLSQAESSPTEHLSAMGLCPWEVFSQKGIWCSDKHHALGQGCNQRSHLLARWFGQFLNFSFMGIVTESNSPDPGFGELIHVQCLVYSRMVSTQWHLLLTAQFSFLHQPLFSFLPLILYRGHSQSIPTEAFLVQHTKTGTNILQVA